MDIQTFSGSERKETYRDKLGIIFCLLFINICCDPSLEPSRQDGSNEGSQHMFLAERVLMRGHNICFPRVKRKTYLRIISKIPLSAALIV